jgi:hypothetical protein
MWGGDSTGTVKATVYDSLASANGNTGFLVSTSAGHAATTLMLFHSVAANNMTGLLANGAGATLRVGQSTVTGNTIGWTASGGSVLSYGDNYIDGNAGNEGPPPSVALK